MQPTVVTASANAAKALSELANNLPNTGGLVSWFTGDNDIGAFGQSLEKFGQSFAGYYNSIAGIDTALLDAVIVELGKLVDMANGISGVDTSGFTRFASDLTTMGNNGIDGFIQAFTNANEKVQQGVTALLTTVTSTMQAQVGTLTASGTTAGQSLGTGLIDGINTQKPLAVAAISGMCVTLIQTMQAGLPSATFNTIGQTNVMQGLINGLNAKRALLLSTARNHCTALVQQFRTSLPSATFNTIGQNVIQAIINGMNAKRELLLATARNLCVALVAKFRTELPTATFQTLGEGLVQALANGIKSKQSTAEETARAVCSATMNAFRNNLSADDLKEVGANAAQGLADGIRSKINEIADAAIDAAKRAVREAKKELDEHSPSKVFFKIGENVDLGMINGILAYLRRVGDAGTELGRETIDSMKSAIRHISDIVNGEMDTEPTIRPVLDMTNVQNGVSEINSLFTKGLNMSASYNKALSAARDNKISSVAADNASGNYQQPASNTYSFVQNNYSPKALSRKDIYRQTKNQFAAMKGAVSST